MAKRTKGGDWQHADMVYGAYPHHAGAGGNVISTTGGKKRKGGRGIMTDIAVPAALLMASSYVGRRKTQHKNKNKRVRFTRRRR